MIDLHSHILHGLDDGPATLDGSLALARKAVSEGTTAIVATPHVRDDHAFPLEAIESGVTELNAALKSERLDLEVIGGGEVALTKIPQLDDEGLRKVCLGDGPYLLVESPYTHAPDLVERMLFEVQARGYRPILAHPERSPSFLSDQIRLARLVENQVLCSVTALSMEGAFGSTVRKFTERLFLAGLVHNVASDAHDLRRRPPGLRLGFKRLDEELPGLADQAAWYATDVPRAILSGGELPSRPEPIAPRERGWRRLFGRRQRAAQNVA